MTNTKEPVLGIYEAGLSEFDKKGVIISNIMVIAMLLAGIFAVYLFNSALGIIYGVIIAVLFLFVMRKGLCTRCFYYGKRCAMGWGLYTAKLFKKGEVSEFKGCAASKFAPVMWMIISFLPLILIIVSAYLSFSILKAILAVILVIFMIIAVSPRKRTCAVCKMRYLCGGSAAKD
ncbi:MAG: hypothetical protein JXQ82_07210 [Methanomicrobiaceae archaeon]|nr:hypothetical protein [Methanomicrobiaceae archaeon]